MAKKSLPNVQIELSNICNAHCVICPISKMKRKREIMNFKLFKNIVDQLSEINFDQTVAPFLEGESLLIPNILDYLRYIRKKLPKAKVSLISNGTRLDKLADSILKEGLLDSLVISFDGGNKESYEAVRRGLSFEKISNNVHKFISRRKDLKKEKPTVSISMVVTNKNYNSQNELKKEFSDADDIGFHKRFNWAGQHGPVKTSKNRLKTFLTKQNYCQRFNSTITILADGRVALCCFDYEGTELLGDLKKQSIMEVWNGKKTNQIIRYLKNRNFEKLPLCSRCDFINHNIISRQVIKIENIISKYPPLYKFLKNLWIKFSPK
jgi:radical SAM protein with 4Fe4S-binding SPASM domain